MAKKEPIREITRLYGALKCISHASKIVVSASDGTATLVGQERPFYIIDNQYEEWGLNKKGRATDETTMDFYQLNQNATFQQIFYALHCDLRWGMDFDLDRFCFSQAQIISIVQHHEKWLSQQNYSTLFLHKKKNQYFVTRLLYYYDNWRFGRDFSAFLHTLENDKVWKHNSGFLVACPR